MFLGRILLNVSDFFGPQRKCSVDVEGLVVAFASSVGVEMGEQGEVSKARPRIF